jgi:hypothetical protein
MSSEVEFVGVRGNDPKVILGSTGPVGGDDRARGRAKLVVTEISQPLPSELVTRLPAPEPLRPLQEMNQQAMTLQAKLRQEKDEPKRAEIQNKIRELAQQRDEKVPALFREVLAQYANEPAAFDVAMNMARSARTMKLQADEAKQIVAIVRRHAEPYGPRFLVPTLVGLAEALGGSKEYLAAALSASEVAFQNLSDESPLALQSRCLSVYQRALEQSGRSAEAQPIAARLAAVEARLDEDYRAKVPPFKPEPFAGRKNPQANRAVVLELFTGAQCPPCVAADVAFDALRQTYQPKDVILVQYHVHIPGPDPMANPATLARWDYYRNKFREAIRGVPSSIFNGAPKAGGGGGMPNSEAKYHQYRDLINDGLANSTPVRLSGQAQRQGDQLSLEVQVDGAAPDAGSELKLRLLLVEDEVKFVGSNSIRFHHHVVRSMIGGPDGVAIQGSSFRHTATIDIAQLRRDLDAYLTNYNRDTRPFPQPGRPLDLLHLKVVALVQDDKNGEILQAAQWDVKPR